MIMSETTKRYEDFMSIGRKDLEKVDPDKVRTLSPYVSMVAPLQTTKYLQSVTIDGVQTRIGKVVGYRFRTLKPIRNIIRFKLKDGRKVCTTDPSGYTKDGSFDVEADTTFDLNLFETMVFYMRDDIFGLISGGEFDLYLFIRTSDENYVTAGLRSANAGYRIRENGIYIDSRIEGKIVPFDGFEQYSPIYKKEKSPIDDAYAVGVLALRNTLDKELWSV